MTLFSALLIALVASAVAVCSVNAAVSSSLSGRSIGKWPKPDNIPWMFDDQFPQNARPQVEAAAAAVSAQIGGGSCVKFNKVTQAPSDGSPYLVVSNRQKPNYHGSNQPLVCDSNPGRWRDDARNVLTIITETKAGAFPCHTNQRVMMGLFYRTLGFYSELQRPDRDTSVDFAQNNLAVPDTDSVVYAVVTPNQAVVLTAFDSASITIPNSLYLAKSSNAASGAVFAPNGVTTTTIGNGGNDALSRSDCIAAAKLYKRENPNCKWESC